MSFIRWPLKKLGSIVGLVLETIIVVPFEKNVPFALLTFCMGFVIAGWRFLVTFGHDLLNPNNPAGWVPLVLKLSAKEHSEDAINLMASGWFLVSVMARLAISFASVLIVGPLLFWIFFLLVESCKRGYAKYNVADPDGFLHDR